MKKLQLTPPLLIITMGYPGSGKTYFGRQFAELYSIARLSEEVFRYELFENPLFNKDEADIIERIMSYSLTEMMKTEQTIICEGSFLKLKQRKSLYELAAKNGYRTLTIWLQRPVEKEQTVVISGKHAFRSQCLTVLRKITSMYSDSLLNGDNGIGNPLADPKRPVVTVNKINRRFIQ